MRATHMPFSINFTSMSTELLTGPGHTPHTSHEADINKLKKKYSIFFFIKYQIIKLTTMKNFQTLSKLYNNFFLMVKINL